MCHTTWRCVIASASFLVASCSSFPQFSIRFGHFNQPFLDWHLEVFPCSDLVKFGVYGNFASSSFPQDWFCAIQSYVWETTTQGSKALEQISIINIVFPNFPMTILVSSEMLSANRENQFIDKLANFEKVLAFWINLVLIRNILCAKVVCRIAVVGKFPAFKLIITVFLASGDFGIYGNLVTPTFQRHRACSDLSLDH